MGPYVHINSWKKYVKIALVATLIIWLISSMFSLFSVSWLSDILGGTVYFESFSNGYDRTVYSDLMEHYPSGVKAIWLAFFYLILIYVPVSIFVNAGIIGVVINKQYSLKSFWEYATKYFSKFLALNLIMLLTLALMLAIIGTPLVMYIGDPLETFDTEKPIVWIVAFVIVLFILIFVLIWLVSFKAKAYIITHGFNITHGLRASLQSITWLYLFKGFAFVCIYVVLMYLFSIVNDLLCFNSMNTLLVLVGVAFSFVILLGKQWMRMVLFDRLDKL